MVGSSSSSRSGAANSAAGELAARPGLRRGVEAEPGQDRGGACRRGVRADVGEPGVDFGDAMRIAGALRLGLQGGQLLVGGEHGVDQALRPVRRLLRQHADARPARQPDAAGIGMQLAGDQLEQGRLAGAVAPDQPGVMSVGQRERGALEQRAPGDPVGEIGDGQHGGG